jgi:hypothetical protein
MIISNAFAYFYDVQSTMSNTLFTAAKRSLWGECKIMSVLFFVAYISYHIDCIVPISSSFMTTKRDRLGVGVGGGYAGESVLFGNEYKTMQY